MQTIVDSKSSSAHAEPNEAMDKDVAHNRVALAPANNDELLIMSEVCNDALLKLGDLSWYQLFRMADKNDSGHLDFKAFRSMIRKLVSSSQLSSSSLRALWQRLATDSSGLISVSEFGAFMRVGKPSLRHDEALEEMHFRQKQLRESACQARGGVAQRIALADAILRDEVAWLEQKREKEIQARRTRIGMMPPQQRAHPRHHSRIRCSALESAPTDEVKPKPSTPMQERAKRAAKMEAASAILHARSVVEKADELIQMLHGIDVQAQPLAVQHMF